MGRIYEFTMPATNLLGVGSINDVGNRLKELGCKKTLLVTDMGIAGLGVPDEIVKICDDAGVQTVLYTGTEPNPTDKNVKEGLHIYTLEQCDSLISLGGGSPHDCAKAIGIVAANGGTIHDYEGVDRSKSPMVPMIAINTTAGTASEITKFTIITDTNRKVKMAIVDKHVTPLISINDPMLMVKKPASLTAATGLDALTHAIEAYVSTKANPVTDACALHAIKLISIYLPRAFADGQDISAREQMSYAQFLAGMAFNNASLGYVHAIAHQFGGFYNLPHGVCNAILLPHVCRFNLPSNEQRFADIALALGENLEGLTLTESAEKAINAIERLKKELNIPTGFTSLGAHIKDIERLAIYSMMDTCSTTNPREATLEEVMVIIQNAM